MNFPTLFIAIRNARPPKPIRFIFLVDEPDRPYIIAKFVLLRMPWMGFKSPEYEARDSQRRPDALEDGRNWPRSHQSLTRTNYGLFSLKGPPNSWIAFSFFASSSVVIWFQSEGIGFILLRREKKEHRRNRRRRRQIQWSHNDEEASYFWASVAPIVRISLVRRSILL